MNGPFFSPVSIPDSHHHFRFFVTWRRMIKKPWLVSHAFHRDRTTYRKEAHHTGIRNADAGDLCSRLSRKPRLLEQFTVHYRRMRELRMAKADGERPPWALPPSGWNFRPVAQA
jgi:hypothetical protein